MPVIMHKTGGATKKQIGQVMTPFVGDKPTIVEIENAMNVLIGIAKDFADDKINIEDVKKECADRMNILAPSKPAGKKRRAAVPKSPKPVHKKVTTDIKGHANNTEAKVHEDSSMQEALESFGPNAFDCFFD